MWIHSLNVNTFNANYDLALIEFVHLDCMRPLLYYGVLVVTIVYKWKSGNPLKKEFIYIWELCGISSCMDQMHISNSG